MAVDPSIIAVLQSGVDANPDDFALRAHLTTLLTDDGRFDEAWPHCDRLLAARPDDAEALALAERIATGRGHSERASSYRRLREALGHIPARSIGPGVAGGTHEETEMRPEPPVTANGVEHTTLGPDDLGDASADDYDAFLHTLVAEAGLDLEVPDLRLDDVGGLDDVKARITNSFLLPMANPELREMYGKSLRGGLLLYGPPGCGKTHLARAVAGELGARFIAVGLTDVLSMWLGQSEHNLHDVFQHARRCAPCVLFLDEIDALGQKRVNLKNSAGRNVVVQLLEELDGLRSANEGLFVLGATNQPWDLDPALRRPGRFDRMVCVLPPDEPARRAILTHHLTDRPLGAIDVAAIAKRTDGYSGADLRLVCETAAEAALVDSVERGEARPISQTDLARAAAEIRPSTRPWLDAARNYVTFANDDGQFDDLAAYLRRHKLI
ncbi:MAG: ATP-binding protein [Actinobacteria bacterium]|nr:ATP-binding protein [Actinomycetota bacterium]